MVNKKDNIGILGVVGDLHLREELTYADCVADRREGERKAVLDSIVESLKDCRTIVFMGDNFHSKNNPSVVVKEFVKFIKRFDPETDLYFLAGNHEKFGDGKSAIDFLKEIKNPNWEVITDGLDLQTSFNGKENLVFCPYFNNAELGVKDYKEAHDKIMEELPNGTILFMHHTIKGSMTNTGAVTDLFEEPVFSKEELLKKYKLVVAGHIHQPQKLADNVLITGSVFNFQVGESNKSVWVIDPDKNYEITEHPLPVRPITKLENPKVQELLKLPKNSIVRVILTDKAMKKEADDIREKLKRFDGYIIVEQYPHEREQKVDFGDGEVVDFSVEKMLELYAKHNKVDIHKLKHALEIINT